VGPASETLAPVVSEKTAPFDFIFIDADKAGYPNYFEWAMKLSRPGTLIVADNVVRKGALLDSNSNDANVQGMRRLLDIIAADRRVSATGIQTVGSKGYDGFVLARVMAERSTSVIGRAGGFSAFRQVVREGFGIAAVSRSPTKAAATRSNQGGLSRCQCGASCPRGPLGGFNRR